MKTEKDAFYPSTIFVTFANVLDEKIELLLDKLGVSGFRVGQVVNRYAVEVPYGQEDKYAQVFSQNGIVKRIHKEFLFGDRRRYRRRNQRSN